MLQHVSDHRGSIIRKPCTVLAKNYKNGSIVSVDMDVVGVVAANFDRCACVWFTVYETCCSTFKCFIILIVSTYYILCISWIIKCLIITDARCKQEDSNTIFIKVK